MKILVSNYLNVPAIGPRSPFSFLHLICSLFYVGFAFFVKKWNSMRVTFISFIFFDRLKLCDVYIFVFFIFSNRPQPSLLFILRCSQTCRDHSPLKKWSLVIREMFIRHLENYDTLLNAVPCMCLYVTKGIHSITNCWMWFLLQFLVSESGFVSVGVGMA